MVSQNEQEGSTRALSVPWASAAVPVLVEQFEDAHAKGGGLGWVYGNAIGVAWMPEHLNEILKIVEDGSFDRARSMIIYGLAKRRDPRVTDVIMGLLDDETVSRQVLCYLLCHPDPRAIAWLERLVAGHGDPMIVSQAKRALAKLQ